MKITKIMLPFMLVGLIGLAGCGDLQEKVNDAVTNEVNAVRCRDCSTKVSESAETCPKCGAKDPQYDKEAYEALKEYEAVFGN